MQTKQSATPEPTKNTATENPDLNESHPPLRARLRPLARQVPGRPAIQGLPLHTLALLGAGTLGPFPAPAVTGAMGDDPQAIETATEELVHTARRQRKLLRELDDALAQLEQRGPAKHKCPKARRTPSCCCAPRP